MNPAKDTIHLIYENLILVEVWDVSTLKDIFQRLSNEINIPMSELCRVARIGVTGRTISPPLFETMEVLGRERCIKRLNALRELVRQLEA